MSWLIRLKLSMLPILDSNRIDAAILSRDVEARLGLPPECGAHMGDKDEGSEAIRGFYSAAAAEAYAEEHMLKPPLNFGRVQAWKRVGDGLVLLSCGPTQSLGFPPVPLECIVRIGESAWELYSFSDSDLCESQTAADEPLRIGEQRQDERPDSKGSLQ